MLIEVHSLCQMNVRKLLVNEYRPTYPSLQPTCHCYEIADYDLINVFLRRSKFTELLQPIWDG